MIAIIGAGLQGACLALELAARGRPTVLIDAAVEPMGEASRWNEGKLHLGFVYANDPTRRSAQAMLRASLAFLPALERLLDRRLADLVAPGGFIYGVPRDTLVPPEQVGAHVAAITELLAPHTARWTKLFGGQEWQPPARLSPHGPFTPDAVAAAFSTPEVAVDTHALADLVADRLRDEPLIRLVTGTDVISVTRQAEGFRLDFADGTSEHGFRQVVNASWRSLMRLDATVPLPAARPWLYRYKAAVQLRLPGCAVPSCTFVVGPYGDMVNFGDGRFYLSWYPACRLALSDRAELPEIALDAARRQEIVAATLEGLAGLLPGIADITLDESARVGGGWIFAWGDSDITDRGSELHRRYDVGASLADGYISLNTGKYCMAPLNAARLARTMTGID